MCNAYLLFFFQRRQANEAFRSIIIINNNNSSSIIRAFFPSEGHGGKSVNLPFTRGTNGFCKPTRKEGRINR